MKKGDVVLIDTNVIIEASSVGTWNALSKFFELHTVEKVIKEAFAGRREDSSIKLSEDDLRQSFSVVYDVEELERLTWAMKHPKAAGQNIHAGERDLLVYLEQSDKACWLLSSPDIGAMKAAHKMGFLDSIVSLEKLNLECGAGKRNLRNNYTEKWHQDIKSKLFWGTL